MRFRCEPHNVDIAGHGRCCVGWDWSIESGRDKASGRSRSPRRAFRDAKKAVRRMRKLRDAVAEHGDET